MRIYTSAVLAIVAFTLGALPARAQDTPSFVFTPFVAIGTDGASPIGASIAVPISSAFSIDTEVAYRRGEGRIHAPSINASLIRSLPRIGRFTPFAAAGLGVSRFGQPAFFRAPGSDEPQIGTRSQFAATVNFGAGATTRITDRFSLRTDARWFMFQGQDKNPNIGAFAGSNFRVSTGVSLDVGKR